MFAPDSILLAFCVAALSAYLLPAGLLHSSGAGAAVGGAAGSVIPGIGTAAGAAIGSVLGGLFGGGGRPDGWQANKEQMGAAIVQILSELKVLTPNVRTAVLNEHFGYDHREAVILAFQAGDVRSAASVFMSRGVPVDTVQMIANYEAATAEAVPGASPGATSGATSGAGIGSMITAGGSNVFYWVATVFGALFILPSLLGGRRSKW